MPTVNLITRKAFRKKLGDVSRSTFWRYSQKDKHFPRPVNLGGSQDLYMEPEADEYILSKAAQRDVPAVA